MNLLFISLFSFSTLAYSATEELWSTRQHNDLDQKVAKIIMNQAETWKNSSLAPSQNELSSVLKSSLFLSYYDQLSTLSILGARKSFQSTACQKELQRKTKDATAHYLQVWTVVHCLNLSKKLAGIELYQAKNKKLIGGLFTKLLNEKRYGPLAIILRDSNNSLTAPSLWMNIAREAYSKHYLKNTHLLPDSNLEMALATKESRDLHESYNLLYKNLYSLITTKKEFSTELTEYRNFITKNSSALSKGLLLKHAKILAKTLLVTPYPSRVVDFIKTYDPIFSAKHKAQLENYLFLSYIYRADYKAAYSYLKDKNLLGSIESKPITIQFWTAYTLKQVGEIKKADQIFNNIIAQTPLSYHAIISKIEAREIYPASQLTKKKTLQNYTLDKGYYASLKRLHLYSKIRATALINRESRYLMAGYENGLVYTKSVPNKDLEREILQTTIEKIAQHLSEEANQLVLSMMIARFKKDRSVELSPILMSSLFPTTYKKSLINHNKSSLDIKLVLSLMKQESAFSTEAKSHAGARGLMQVMPQTARQYRRISSIDQLYNPQINMTIGTTHLNKLYKKYNGNLVWTLAAYNAGEGNVSKWHQNLMLPSNVYLQIESIPFKETRQYVQLILRNYYYYSKMDAQDSTLIKLKEGLNIKSEV